jgi:hypothetical protein
MLREIADDPHGFILRQGWADLDFSDEVEIAQLRRLAQIGALNLLASNLGKIIGSGPVSGSCRRPEYECTRNAALAEIGNHRTRFRSSGSFPQPIVISKNRLATGVYQTKVIARLPGN